MEIYCFILVIKIQENGFDFIKLLSGRAGSSSVIDVFITLLSLGKEGYLKLVEERVTLFDYLRDRLFEFAKNVGEEVLYSAENPISIGNFLP